MSSLAERDSLINRLETEAANSAALLGNIQQSIKRLDPNADSGVHEIAPEGAVRLLIRTDGDSEVVHVLGRKTTVGRTPDNDLQIDAKFISRNHAVILAGPNHTIIEDLNSTNGVAVNGKRISRHTLRDGDKVSIGKTSFRFAVASADRRALSRSPQSGRLRWLRLVNRLRPLRHFVVAHDALGAQPRVCVPPVLGVDQVLRA